jgi:hypothetical protein
MEFAIHVSKISEFLNSCYPLAYSSCWTLPSLCRLARSDLFLRLSAYGGDRTGAQYTKLQIGRAYAPRRLALTCISHVRHAYRRWSILISAYFFYMLVSACRCCGCRKKTACHKSRLAMQPSEANRTERLRILNKSSYRLASRTLETLELLDEYQPLEGFQTTTFISFTRSARLSHQYERKAQS